MTAILDRVPVDRISAEARETNFSRVALVVIAAVLYGIGWTAAKIVGLLGMAFRWLGRALVWSGTAVKVGWMEARKPRAAGRGVAA